MLLFIASALLIFNKVPKPDTSAEQKPYQKRIKNLSIVLPILAAVFALINFLWPEIGYVIVKGFDFDHITRPAIYIKMLFDIISLSIFAYLRFVRDGYGRDFLGTTNISMGNDRVFPGK
jgi:hypothetical protein